MSYSGVGSLTVEVCNSENTEELVKNALVRISGTRKHSMDKQVKLSANTKHLGFVRFADIPFDTYNIVVSRKSFEPIIVENVIINIAGEDPVGNTVRARNSAKINFPAATAYPLPNYVVNHIPTTTPNNRRPGTSMTPNTLTIHSTNNPSSSAQGERGWLTNPTNHNTVSYHIVVDEKEAIETLPLNEKAYHAADGPGPGNTQSLSLEICESGDRTKTFQNAIILTAKLLRDRGWDESKLRKHQDWPRRDKKKQKDCPQILLLTAMRKDPKHTWEWFKIEVRKQLGLMGLYYEEL